MSTIFGVSSAAGIPVGYPFYMLKTINQGSTSERYGQRPLLPGGVGYQAVGAVQAGTGAFPTGVQPPDRTTPHSSTLMPPHI